MKLIGDGLLISAITSENSIEYTLENEDYTVGNVIASIMFHTYIGRKENNATLAFCGFKKMHPHDTNSIIRIIFDARDEPDDDDTPKSDEEPRSSILRTLGLNYIKKCCNDAIEIFDSIGRTFVG